MGHHETETTMGGMLEIYRGPTGEPAANAQTHSVVAKSYGDGRSSPISAFDPAALTRLTLRCPTNLPSYQQLFIERQR